MDVSFNLANEPWIPIVLKNGSTREVSIREALANAQEYRQVLDASPLVTMSIHRLLLAILHRNFGPSSRDEWLRLWNEGWADGRLSNYLDKWQQRFDLFSEDRPFYQSPGLRVKELAPVSKLAHELSAGHNAALFDHSSDDDPPRFVPSVVARLIVAMQSYAMGGGKSATVNLRHAPLVQGMGVLLRGETLFQTLMLNLIRPDGNGVPPHTDDDRPCWEMDSRGDDGSFRKPNGYLDYLTWQSRGIRFEPRFDGGRLTVSQMAFAQGVGIPEDLHVQDPMFLYMSSEKLGLKPLRLDPNREVWRNSAALLCIGDSGSRPPVAISWISEFVIDGALDESYTYNLELYGLAAEKAKIHLWRHEVVPLPLRYLSHKELVGALSESMVLAERCEAVLRRSSATLAKLLLSPSGSRADPKALSALVRSFDVTRPYWLALESRFYELVVDLAKEVDGIGSSYLAMIEWSNAVRREARRSFMNCLAGQSGSAQAIMASTLAEREFNVALAKLIKGESNGRYA